MSDENSDKLLPVAQLRRRYSVCSRTLDRWLEDGILPQPVRINRYRYWRESDLERFERERMSAGTTKPAA